MLEQGEVIANQDRANDATLGGWIRHCKRSGLYEQGMLLADIFYRMGYVERLGSGIYRMRSAMAAEHLPAPRFLPTVNAFKVELFSSFLTAGLSQEEAEICQWLSHKGRATIKEFLEAFSLAKATMNRRLAKLAKDGLIKVHGSGRGTFYTLDYGPGVLETK